MLIEKDIVILGGGIAGLWLLNRLRNAGYAAVLLERAALGTGQSIASQGMIHGGMKYALGGSLTGASESIADMPQHWQNCLQGKGDVDLRGARLLSDAYYMLPRQSVRSRLNAFFGSKAVRGKIAAVEKDDLPEFFQGHLNGPLYRLHDIVLDVPSLLATLANNAKSHIYHIDWKNTQVSHGSDGTVQAITLHNGDELRAQRFITTCGEGTEALLQLLEPPKVAMQKRPLQMVVVKHRLPHTLYVHCVSDQLTATPELTVTTHHCKDGAKAWYLGGELAESGAHISKEEQISRSKTRVAELFPWCDFSRAAWHSFYINRAEAKQADGKRPDNVSVQTAANVLYCWPTKLTLAPILANTVLDTLRAQSVVPGQSSDAPLYGLEFPGIAVSPWDAMADETHSDALS
ncbi:MAG: FAD-dependent oxidoreductase [Pseudomonadota bacterium]